MTPQNPPVRPRRPRPWSWATLKREAARFTRMQPEQAEGIAVIDVASNMKDRLQVRGVTVIDADARFKKRGLHVFYVRPWSEKMMRDKRLVDQWKRDLAARFPDCPEPMLRFGSSRRMLQAFLSTVKGRLLVSHNLAVDQAALRRWFRSHGLGWDWPLAFAGVDSLRCEKQAGHADNTLKAAAARLGVRNLPKAMLTDGLKTVALARRHGGDLAGLQRLARKQMDARLDNLKRHPGHSSWLTDPKARKQAIEKNRKILAARPRPGPARSSRPTRLRRPKRRRPGAEQPSSRESCGRPTRRRPKRPKPTPRP